MTRDPRAQAPKYPTCCLLGPLRMKAERARELGEEMEVSCHPAGALSLSKTLSPQISKREMKPLQEEERNILEVSSSSL